MRDPFLGLTYLVSDNPDRLGQTTHNVLNFKINVVLIYFNIRVAQANNVKMCNKCTFSPELFFKLSRS